MMDDLWKAYEKAPERIWAHPTEREPMPARLKSHARWRRGKWKDHDSNAHGDMEYVRHDHALALVAAAYEDAATTASCECQCGPVSLEAKILRRAPTDAQAALEARDKRVREEALREAAAKAKYEGEEFAGMREGVMFDRLSKDILALIEGDTDE